MLVGEEQLAPGVAEVPLEVVGERAEEDVGALLRLPHSNGGMSECRTSDSERAAKGMPPS